MGTKRVKCFHLVKVYRSAISIYSLWKNARCIQIDRTTTTIFPAFDDRNEVHFQIQIMLIFQRYKVLSVRQFDYAAKKNDNDKYNAINWNYFS